MQDSNLVMWLLDLLAIATLCGLTACVVAVIRLRKLATRDQEPRIDVSDCRVEDVSVPAGRPLGKMEVVFHKLHKGGNLQVTMLAVMRATTAVSDTVVRQVMQRLCSRHPMLRMRIVEINGNPHFVPACDNIPLRSVRSDNWLKTFEENLTHDLDETKHLWKVTIVHGVDSVDTGCSGPNEIAFIFAFHHSMGDGLCKSRLITEFTEMLNDMLLGSGQVLDTYDMLPALDNFIGKILQRSSSETAVFQTLDSSQNASLLKTAQDEYLIPPTVNAFVEKVGAVCLEHPTVESATCMVPIRFTEEETENILRACRASQATVQGLLTAATSITMAEMLDAASTSKQAENTTSVQMRTTVNMRRYFAGNVPENYMGSYFVGLFAQNIPIPSGARELERFWSSARDNTHNIHSQLQDRIFITNFWNLLETVYHVMSAKSDSAKPRTSTNGPNRLNEVLSLNNYGKCPSRGRSTDLVKLTGCFCAVSEHKRGPIFTINAVTVEGQLCLSFVFYTNITSREFASNFANNVRCKILKNSNV